MNLFAFIITSDTFNQKILSLGLSEKSCLHNGVIVPTVISGAQTCDVTLAERRNVNVFEMKCLRSMGMSDMHGEI